MFRLLRWICGLLLLWLLLLAAALFGLHLWLGTEDFLQRVQAQASARLGVEVRLGGLDVDPWPVPAIALRRIEVRTQPALTAERIELRPVLQALLRGRIEVATVLLRQAHLSEAGIAQLLAAAGKPAAAPAGGPAAQGQSPAPVAMPRRIVFEGVGWRSVSGKSLVVDGTAELDTEGLPERGRMQVVEGFLQHARLAVQRTTAARWTLELDIAGGRVEGEAGFAQSPLLAGPAAFSGRLETRGVALDALGRTLGAASPLQGRLEATTTLEAAGPSLALLAGALKTQTRFTLRDAVVRGVDLSRAVRTAGSQRGGETRFDTFSGHLATQGGALQFTELTARSGVLQLGGNVTVRADRALRGRVEVVLGPAALGAVVGVPLQVGGTLDAPEVTLTRAALLGAAVGTAVLPGVGTGAGARLGDRVGDAVKGLFGK